MTDHVPNPLIQVIADILSLNQTPPMKIAIMLFEQVDLLDFGGPYEVFLTASRLAVRHGQCEPFNIVSVSPDGRGCSAYGGLQVHPSCAVADAPPFDLLIVPGTIDLERALADDALLQAIRSVALQQDCVIASVCTGAFLLAEARLLDGLAWTTHWEDIPLLAQRLGAEGARENVRWVDNGRIITAAGLASGIDMALHLVHRFAGLALAQQTARQIDHDWSESA